MHKQGCAYYWDPPRVLRAEEPFVGEGVEKNVVLSFFSIFIILSEISHSPDTYIVPKANKF